MYTSYFFLYMYTFVQLMEHANNVQCRDHTIESHDHQPHSRLASLILNATSLAFQQIYGTVKKNRKVDIKTTKTYGPIAIITIAFQLVDIS